MKPPIEQRRANATWLVIAITVVALPLFYYTAAADPFRLPKSLFLRGSGIVLLVLAALEAIWRGARPSLPRPPFHALVALIALWSVISAAFAGEHVSAVATVTTILGALLLFLATHHEARHRGLLILLLPAAVAAIESVVALMQTGGIWFPLITGGGEPDHLMRRVAPLALLGNRNDLGCFLVAPALALAALLLMRARRLWLHASLFIIILAGLFASRTVTAIFALLAGLLIMGLLYRPKIFFVIALSSCLVVSAAIAFYPPLHLRYTSAVGSIHSGDIDRLLTNRVVSFLAAIEMARLHPWTGVGAGQYERAYYNAKIRAAEKWPRLLPSGGSEDNFSEAHNDALQTAAEYGFPGLLLFLASFVAVGSLSFRIRDLEEEKAAFVRYYALPFAVAIFVLTLAQFPLQLAAVATLIAFFCGIVTAWSEA